MLNRWVLELFLLRSFFFLNLTTRKHASTNMQRFSRFINQTKQHRKKTKRSTAASTSKCAKKRFISCALWRSAGKHGDGYCSLFRHCLNTNYVTFFLCDSLTGSYTMVDRVRRPVVRERFNAVKTRRISPLSRNGSSSWRQLIKKNKTK